MRAEDFIDPDDEIEKAEYRMDQDKLRAAVKANMSSLTPNERTILNKVFWHDMNPSQAAKSEGLTPGRGWQIYNKAMRKLRNVHRDLSRFVDPDAGIKRPDPNTIKVDPGTTADPYYLAGYNYGSKTSEIPVGRLANLDYDQRLQFEAGFAMAQRQKATKR